MSDNHRHIKNLSAWKRARVDCFDRDDYTCVDCGATEGLQADHETPLDVLFADGVTIEAIALAVDVDNLRTRCASCNASKGARIDAVVVRHTWICPRYATVLGWIETEASDDPASVNPVFRDETDKTPPSSVFPPMVPENI
ncbi:hypothetical protein [Aeromicrobium sp.]|uniref:HNH endonuclease n=1 Tax=Aeromicrobium sp. TaxID=1871063 RepID=UPI0030C48201